MSSEEWAIAITVFGGLYVFMVFFEDKWVSLLRLFFGDPDRDKRNENVKTKPWDYM